MAKKKITPISVSQEETAQAQHVFEHYHQIATNLRVSEPHLKDGGFLS